MFFKKKEEPVVDVPKAVIPKAKYKVGDVLTAESEESDIHSKDYDRIAELREKGFIILDFPTIQVKTTGTCISRRYNGEWFYTIAYDGFKTIGAEFREQNVYRNK